VVEERQEDTRKGNTRKEKRRRSVKEIKRRRKRLSTICEDGGIHLEDASREKSTANGKGFWRRGVMGKGGIKEECWYSESREKKKKVG
jgi:hypothetical protein